SYNAERPIRIGHGGSSGMGWAAIALLLGIALSVVGVLAIFMWSDARSARDDAKRAAARVSRSDSTAPLSGVTTSTAGTLQSYAGAAPANADELAVAHAPYPAALPAAPPGPVANVNLVLKDVTVQIAPGVKYAAWAWAGGAPGPVIH